MYIYICKISISVNLYYCLSHVTIDAHSLPTCCYWLEYVLIHVSMCFLAVILCDTSCIPMESDFEMIIYCKNGHSYTPNYSHSFSSRADGHQVGYWSKSPLLSPWPPRGTPSNKLQMLSLKSRQQRSSANLLCSCNNMWHDQRMRSWMAFSVGSLQRSGCVFSPNVYFSAC